MIFMDTDKLKLFVFASMFYDDTGRLLQELVCIYLCALLITFVLFESTLSQQQSWPMLCKAGL